MQTKPCSLLSSSVYSNLQLYEMGLVDYSDSDASDGEQVTIPKPSTTSKSGFQKVVDRSNPGKIRVSLPQVASQDENRSEEPPAKRAKIGGGGGAFSGFNSFLPAPKRAGQTNATTTTSSKKQGLVPGVSLKTGAAPGFSRDVELEREEAFVEEEPAATSGMNLPAPKTTGSVDQKPAEEVKLVGKPLMFRPLSVSRKPVKKKKQATGSGTATTPVTASSSTPNVQAEQPVKKPKVSLFSMGPESETPAASVSTGEYKPMLYETDDRKSEEEEEEGSLLEAEPSYEEYTPTTNRMAPPAVPTPPVSQSLDDIAGDLNLTDSQKRQLFGRQKGGRMQSAHKVINFNTDQEYLHNEELRAAGEQVSHNPVRSIASGKHSLKQLVSNAQSQKEALEESFATGKSNRAAASSRYGW